MTLNKLKKYFFIKLAENIEKFLRKKVIVKAQENFSKILI